MPSTIETSAIIANRYGRDCSQSKLLHGISNGTVPAERRGGRWFIDEADIPAIAKLYPTRKTQAAA